MPRKDDLIKVENAELVNNQERLLTRSEFQGLANVPPEIEWFANITNKNTKRAYEKDLQGFMDFCGIQTPEEFRVVTRSHIISWRKTLETNNLGSSTIRRKLSAISSLFEYLCEKNAVTHNPVKGVKRPNSQANEGRTPALSDDQARILLEAPRKDTLKGVRDRAILAVLLYHGLRREELCRLKVGDLQLRRGVMYLSIHGKGDRTRYVVAHPKAIELIEEYTHHEKVNHYDDHKGALFRPVRSKKKDLTRAITPDAIYKIIRAYSRQSGVYFEGIRPHSMRATAATNALDNQSDIAKVQEWLGHANIATTRIYDKRNTRPEDSPTLKISYK